MFEHFWECIERDHTKTTKFLIKEQDIRVGWVDVIERPQLQVTIIVRKDYIDDFNILYEYERDFLELLEYETGIYMPVKSETVSEGIDCWYMDIEFYCSY